MQSLGRAVPLRRDPAPSRWAYRMQRLWLTPLFHTDQRANSKRTNTVPAGYSTPVAQVL